MENENIYVKHRIFGRGKIQKIFSGKVTIYFEDHQSRVFQYPEAFENYLEFESTKEQAKVLDMIINELEDRAIRLHKRKEKLL